MATQSGIAVTPELSEAWAGALANGDIRLVKVSIQDEQLVPSGTFPTLTPSSADADDALEGDFALFDTEGVVEEKTPAYYLFRLTPPPNSTFLFLSYVPDSAPVRSKMLYASTRATLLRSLGDARISSSLFATSRSELSHASYVAQTKHEEAEAPLTAREAEVEAIRQAEKQQAQEAGEGDEEARRQGRSMIFGSTEEKDSTRVGGAKGVLPWSDEAKEAVKALGIASGEEGARDYVQLEIDVPNETVVLSPDQPADLVLPSSSPCYFFLRHAAGLVLIYSCPPSSPVKSRLVYSSASLVLYKFAVPEFTGQQVLKKLETDDPAEVTAAWIDSELGPLATPAAVSSAEADAAMSAPGSGGSTPLPQEDDKPKFARPQRPGRRR
ncbi:hypothetical protein JCM6882_000164 [Rhodosporidiobolus microsporus]